MWGRQTAVCRATSCLPGRRRGASSGMLVVHTQVTRFHLQPCSRAQMNPQRLPPPGAAERVWLASPPEPDPPTAPVFPPDRGRPLFPEVLAPWRGWGVSTVDSGSAGPERVSGVEGGGGAFPGI